MKMYIVCSGEQGLAVLIGRAQAEPVQGEPIRLVDARMILEWDAACGGLLGLAGRGPRGNRTRITHSVPATGPRVVHDWVECSASAAEEIDAWPAC